MTGSVRVTWRCPHQKEATTQTCKKRGCSGSWYARVRFDKYDRKTGGYESKEQAEEQGRTDWAKLITGGLPAEEKPTKPTITVNDLLDAYTIYLDERVTSGTMTKATRSGYLSNIRIYLRPILGEEPLSGLTFKRVRQFHVQCREKNPALSGPGQRNINATLSAAITYAQREEEENEWFTRQNPCIGQTFEPSRFTAVIWEIEEVRQFWHFARHDDYFAAYALAVLLGVRRGEALGIYEEAIDWRKNIWRADRQVERENWPLTSPLKTEAKGVSYKNLYLSPEIITVINELIARRRDLKSEAFREKRPFYEDPEGRTLLCIEPTGKPFDPIAVTKHFKTICKLAKLRPIRFQDLRGTHANLLQDEGASPRLIQDMLGHKEGSAVTNKHYLQASLREQQRIRGLLSDRLGLEDDGDDDEDPPDNVVSLAGR